MEYVTVEGCEFDIYENGILNTNGEITVTSIASLNSKVEGKGIYTNLMVSVMGYSAISPDVQPWVSGSGATIEPGQISASAQNTKIDNFPVVLEGDEATNVTILGLKQEGSTTVSAQVNVTIKVRSAGQQYMKAE